MWHNYEQCISSKAPPSDSPFPLNPQQLIRRASEKANHYMAVLGLGSTLNAIKLAIELIDPYE